MKEKDSFGISPLRISRKSARSDRDSESGADVALDSASDSLEVGKRFLDEIDF